MNIGAEKAKEGSKGIGTQKEMLMPIEGKKPVSKNGQATAEASVMDAWVSQGKELDFFASSEASQKWFDENDPEGVGFMCEADEVEPMPSIASSRQTAVQAKNICVSFTTSRQFRIRFVRFGADYSDDISNVFLLGRQRRRLRTRRGTSKP